MYSFQREEQRPMDDFNGFISQNWRPPQVSLENKPVHMKWFILWPDTVLMLIHQTSIRVTSTCVLG